MYGNPLGLKFGEIRDMEPTMEIDMLLQAGVYVYAPKQTNIAQKQPLTEQKPINTIKSPITLKVKGIGKKTMKDINDIYADETQLKDALKTGKAGLRDDVVEKLQKYYKIILKK